MTLPHWIKRSVFPSLSPTTQPFVPSRPSLPNTFTSLFQHNQPRGHTHAKRTVLLANTYLTDKLQTHSTLQMKPELSLITSTVTQKNVSYTIQCNHCSKRDMGETKRRLGLKDRFNEHCRPVDNPSNISKPTTVSEHFLTNDHSVNDITVISQELIKSNRDSVR